MNHGIEAEANLINICNSIFGPDIVAHSPKLHEKGGFRELADVIIECLDTVIIVQSKSVQITAQDLDDIRFRRVNKKLEHAKQQISTTLNAHRDQAHVTYKNVLGIETQIDWSNIHYRVGLITLRIEDQNFSDPNSRYQMNQFIGSHRGIDIHYMLLSDLDEAANLINTLSDFKLYLATRKLFSQSKNILIANELDLLALFKTKYENIQQLIDSSNKPNIMCIENGLWENCFENKKIVNKIAQNLSESRPFDEIIRKISTSIEYESEKGTYTTEQATSNYKTIIGQLSYLCRVIRRQIGRKITEKIRNTEHKNHSYFIQIAEDQDIAFLFLIINQPKGNIRSNTLYLFAEEASFHLKQFQNNYKISNILCVALSGKKNANDTSIDFLFGSLNDLIDGYDSSNSMKLFEPPKSGTTEEWEQQ